MTITDEPADPPIGRSEAQAFCTELTETVDSLIRVLEEEARLVRDAKHGEAHALAGEKAELVGRYGHAHGIMKAKGGEIGRQAAVEIDHLRRRHEALETAAADNLAVLATARTVSETLIRGVIEAVSPGAARPDTYGADGRQSPSARPRGALSVNIAL